MLRPSVKTIQFKPSLQSSAQMLALLAAVFLSPWCYGQTATEPTSIPTTIVTSVEEVTLDLVVRDKKDKPVLDLKPEDITITDNGAQVKLSGLHHVSEKAATQHMVTFVFDQLDPSSAKNARDISARILKALSDNGFTFAVLRIDGRLKLLQQLTSDRAALTRAIGAATEKIKATSGNIAAEPEKDLIAVAQTGNDLSGKAVSAQERSDARNMLMSLEESQRILQDQHSVPALSCLLALARTQRQFPGRKVVFYFAQGLQADSRANDILQSITGAASRSSVSIYTIDTNSLNQQVSQALLATVAVGGAMSNLAMNPAPTLSGLPEGMADIAAPGVQSQMADQLNRFEHGSGGGRLDPMGELAFTTGGTYIGSGDNLKRPLQRLVEDMTTYYEASYVPSIEEYDGKFRPVQIKPLRKGIRIRSRAGYFAIPPGTGLEIRPFEAPLMKMLGEPQLVTDVRFRTGILQLGDLPDGNAGVLVVEVPLSSLDVHEDPNTNLFAAHASIVAQIKNKAGTVVEHFSEDVPRHGALEAMASAQSEVITLQRHFIAAPGEYVMEVAVLDRYNGKAGSQRVNFEIPNPPAGPSLGDLALVRRTEPFRGEADPLEPMRYENGKVVPNLSGNVPRGVKNISLFFMVHPDPHSSEPARLEMEVARNGEMIGHMPLQLRKTSGTGAVPYLASIRANSLSGGDYELKATITQSGKTEERNISFRVDGPQLASVAATTKVGDSVNSNGNDAAPVSDTGPGISGMETSAAHRLVITALPASTVIAPEPEELQAIIADARTRAVSYATSLPNFLCVEVTDRSVDPLGTGRWKHKDSLAELLRYHDNQETRSTLEVNGKRSGADRSDLKGTLSHGEFGGVLKAIFDPAAKADFEWKESDALGGGTVQVLSYRVAQKNSSFGLTGDNNYQVSTGFHGLVYVDAATRGVRRLTLEADDLPQDFSIHAASISVDYDYIAIGTHDYLMPVSGSVSLKQHKHEQVLNEVMFRSYRRYGSKMKMVFTDPTPH